jgi:hypothetical protein
MITIITFTPPGHTWALLGTMIVLIFMFIYMEKMEWGSYSMWIALLAAAWHGMVLFPVRKCGHR